MGSVVVFQKTACPRCGSTRCPVGHTDREWRAGEVVRRVRHHRCMRCGERFQSVEKEREEGEGKRGALESRKAGKQKKGKEEERKE